MEELRMMCYALRIVEEQLDGAAAYDILVHF